MGVPRSGGPLKGGPSDKSSRVPLTARGPAEVVDFDRQSDVSVVWAGYGCKMLSWTIFGSFLVWGVQDLHGYRVGTKFKGRR